MLTRLETRFCVMLHPEGFSSLNFFITCKPPYSLLNIFYEAPLLQAYRAKYGNPP